VETDGRTEAIALLPVITSSVRMYKHMVECDAMIVQDTVVYGALAVLFLLTIILLGVDLGSNVLAEFIPPSTTRVHIAALVCLLTSLKSWLFKTSVSVRH